MGIDSARCEICEVGGLRSAQERDGETDLRPPHAARILLDHEQPCALFTKAWEPLLFDGEPQGVSNGKRRTKRTPEGHPVMAFGGLMADLGGLTRNQVLFAGTTAPVTIYATPSPLQQKAFDLLGLSHIE